MTHRIELPPVERSDEVLEPRNLRFHKRELRLPISDQFCFEKHSEVRGGHYTHCGQLGGDGVNGPLRKVWSAMSVCTGCRTKQFKARIGCVRAVFAQLLVMPRTFPFGEAVPVIQRGSNFEIPQLIEEPRNLLTLRGNRIRLGCDSWRFSVG